MRTTIAIDDHLLASAKRRARRRGLTLGQLIEEALRLDLSLRRAGKQVHPDVPVFKGKGGVRPGIDLSSNRAMLEVLDEGQPVEQLR